MAVLEQPMWQGPPRPCLFRIVETYLTSAAILGAWFPGAEPLELPDGTSIVIRHAVYPDGGRECLVSIADWDPSWQGMYTFREPKKLPAGTRLELEATYDNTANNHRNPNSPPKDVPYGEKATNEMCSVYVGFIREAAQ